MGAPYRPLCLELSIDFGLEFFNKRPTFVSASFLVGIPDTLMLMTTSHVLAVVGGYASLL